MAGRPSTSWCASHRARRSIAANELGHNDKSQWETDLKDQPRDPWQATMYVPMMSHDGEVCTYTTNSGSGIRSVHRLLRRYATHAARHPDVYPLVKLKKSFWVHNDKAIGKVFYADFEPAGWLDRKEFVEALEMLGVAIDGARRQAKALPDSAPSLTTASIFTRGFGPAFLHEHAGKSQ